MEDRRRNQSRTCREEAVAVELAPALAAVAAPLGVAPVIVLPTPIVQDDDGRHDADPKIDGLPSFVAHPVFDAYFCLDCAQVFQLQMREYKQANSNRKGRATAAKSHAPEVFVGEAEKRDAMSYRCELCR